MRYLSLLVLFLLFACNSEPNTLPADRPSEENVSFDRPRVPDWHKNANIYEVNLRHYTPEGTIGAFRQQLPRLADMGVDILWFMPVHPISETNRKGELGSPYAVADYKGVNPDFGTTEDFKAMVEDIHDAGMYLIIDWVPNHSGWDNPWITDHPDWYTKGADGEITDPINPGTGESWGWTDVADLNYDNPEMRAGMVDAMKYWVTEIGVDGFRVDVAHGVPVDFFVEATNELYAIRPLFMLAESEVPELRNSGSFVMDYAWEMHHVLNEIAKTQGVNREAMVDESNIAREETQAGEGTTALDIDRVLAKYDSLYTSGYKMQFTSNHDENAWAGTEFQRMGEGHKAFAVLTATFDGMPLIYSGQESAVDKQFEFFKKDEIEWGDYEYAEFYKTLFELKHRNEGIWNGEYGGELVKINTGVDEDVYAFTREKNGDRVVVMVNLSGDSHSFRVSDEALHGTYTDVFNDAKLDVADQEFNLGPWDYVVLESSAASR